MIINNIGINFAGGGGGGTSAVLESKDYSITQNGETTIEPSEGVDGISGGTITVAVPGPVLESKNYTINTNGDTTITPSQGVNGISGGTISVSVTPSLTADTFTENGTYTPGEGIDGFSSVTVNVGGVQENRLRAMLDRSITALTQSDTSGVTSINTPLSGLTNLKTIDLASSVTSLYAAYPFVNCSSLESANLNNVTSIGRYGFQGCCALTQVSMEKVTNSLPEACFRNCKALTGNFTVYNEKFPDKQVFDGCTGITSLTCYNNVTQMSPTSTNASYGIFQGCTGMQMIDLTRNTSIPTLKPANFFSAFTENYEIRVPQSLVDTWKTNADWTNYASHIVGYPDVYYTVRASYTSTGSQISNLMTQATKTNSEWDGVSAGYEDFYGNYFYVSNSTFQNNNNVTSFSLSGTSSEANIVIGNTAFQSAKNLSSVTLMEGVSEIRAQAFQSCTALTSINLPSSLKTIGDKAFYGCTSLQSITIPEDAVLQANGAIFSGCGITSVTINAKEKLPANCLNGANNLTSVVFGPQVTGIPANCFTTYYGPDNNITSLTFQSSTPPTCDTRAFEGFSNHSGVIYCPADAVEAYTVWKQNPDGMVPFPYWTVQAISS